MAAIKELAVVGDVCLPGTPVVSAAAGAVVAIGNGITHARGGGGAGSDEVLVATVGGLLRRGVAADDRTPKYWIAPVATKGGRYVPAVGDMVVGFVVRSVSQAYYVNIGAAHPAILEVLEFDGATKTNRPKLKNGDVIYCHVTSTAVGMDVTLSCKAVGGAVAKDWMTGEATFGPLEGGTVINVSLPFARGLLGSGAEVLLRLGDRVPYECTIGLNGRLWVKAMTQHATLAISQCLLDVESQGPNCDIFATVASYFQDAQ